MDNHYANLVTIHRLVNILESNKCPCEEELLNINVDVQSRLTRVFALNYFRRDYKSADAFMKKLWMDLKSFQARLPDVKI